MTTSDGRRRYRSSPPRDDYRRRTRDPRTGDGQTSETETPSPPPRKSTRRKSSSSSSSHDPIINGLPGRVFAMVLGLWSIAINMHNLYYYFAPEASARFVATGILNFIAALPVFNLIAFVFRVGMAALAFLLFRIMRQKRLFMNPIWLIIWSSCLYGAIVGIVQVIMTFPLLLSMYLVAALQYAEIIFWNARKPSIQLWMLVLGAYGVEIWLQYEMMPFHTDYATSLGLVMAMGSLGDFNWAGFQPIQCLFAAIGVFGIEMAERILKITEKYG